MHGGALYFAATVLKKGAFRLTRITSFLDPWADPTGDGWQVIQGLYAIRLTEDYLVQALEIVLKNIYIYQNLKMTSFSQLLLRS